MKCPNCSFDNLEENKFCMSCGAPMDAQPPAQPQDSYAQQPYAQDVYQQQPYQQQPYQQAPQQPYQQNPYQQQPYQQQPYQQPYPGQFQQPYGETQETTGMLVWSIITLAMCCMPLGIFALLNVLNAKKATTPEEFAAKMKTAKTCNIVAIVVTVVIGIVYGILMAAGIAGSFMSEFPMYY